MKDQAQTNDMLFAVAYGIRIALESHGKSIDDPEAINPILERMNAILGSPKHSLIQSRDDVDMDWDQFRDLRRREQELCGVYLATVAAQGGT